MTQILNVEYRKVETLIPYCRNARTHSEAQVAQLAASIVEYGWTNPLLVDGDNGVISGHGRLLGARKLGLAEVPVIELAHLTPTQKRAYILADNQLALNAGWDEKLLALELAELSDSGYDLELTGFDADELADLMVGEETTTEGATDEDAAPEAGYHGLNDLFADALHRYLRLQPGERGHRLGTIPDLAHFTHPVGLAGDFQCIALTQRQARSRVFDLVIPRERQPIEHGFIRRTKRGLHRDCPNLDGGQQSAARGRIVQISDVHRHQAMVSLTSTPGR